MPTR
jgi:hypothetical protein